MLKQTFQIGDPIVTPFGTGEVGGVEYSEGTNWVFARVDGREFRLLASEVEVHRPEAEKRGFRD